MKKINKYKKYKQIIWSKRVMGSIVVAGALISACVFGLNGYFGGGEQGIPEDTMTRGLVAYYSFDEGSGQTAYNAADTGSANDGTLGSSAFVDSADPTWTRPDLGASLTRGVGPSGSALDFDGSNDYVNCGKDSSLNITDAITIEAWVKPAVDMEASGGWFIVYKKDERATNSGYGIWIVDGQLGVWINNATRQYNASLSVDTWIFITGTYEDGSLKIYENGELKSTHTDVTGSISTNAIDLIIGKEGPSYANYFNGSIDEVKIYNRALSASEIRYHYNRGGPVAHWRFDEGEGQVVYDSTGNNNDGTLGATSASASDDPSWVVGKHNSALEFDGSDDYVSVPDDDSLDITDAITIELWVNDPPPESPESLTQSEQQEQRQQQKQEQEQKKLTQPTILNALVDPTNVQPDGMMIATAEIKDDYGIESVKSDILEIRSEKLKDREYIENQRSADSIISNQNFIKKYESKEKSLLIQNKDKSKMIDLELVSPYNTRVSEGNSVLVADMLLKDWKGRNNLFDELNFYDVKDDYNKLEKQFVYKYAEEKIIQIPIEIPEIGEKFIEERVADWDNAVEFNTLDELPHKNIRVGIFTETILNEKIEWLPTIYGFDIYEWAAYDVTELHYLEHDTDMGTSNSLVMIDSTHFILAYNHSYFNHYGYIKTFSIDGSYNITQIDSLQHDTSGTYNSLVMIDSTHFILAYSDYYSDGCITTFSIDGSYNITELHSIEHDTTNGTHNSLVMIDSTHFILAYAGSGDDGYITTFSIDGSYNITELHSIEHDTSSGIHNSLVMIDSTHFILAYNYNYFTSNYGYIKTFSIDGSYNITQIDSLQHDGTNGAYNSFVKIDSTHFILAYSGSGGDGYIKVFTIDGSYNISQTSSIEHDTVYATYSSLVMIDSTHFILAYCNSSGFFYYGYIKVFSIDGSYNITQESSLQHDGTNGEYNSLVKIDGTHFILAYTGSGDDGYIKTFSMESGNSAPTVTISASTSVEETTATLNGNVTATGGDNPSVTVYWGTSDGGTTPASWASNSAPTSPSQPQGVASFYKNAASLNPGTLYYFSAKATNSAGTDWPAASLSFTTKPNPPTSLSATAQSQTQIDVSWTKGSGAEKTMVRRKIGSYPTSVSDGDQAYFDTGSNFNDTSLSCGNNYYYRAWSYKTNAPNSGYSDSYAEDNASTNACNSAPTVTISASTSVEETTATLNGNVTATGGDNPSVTVYWGTSDGGTTPASWASNSAPTSPSQPQGVASFYKNAASLNPGTLYYFSAKATNSAGTDWPAASLSFTTKPNPPTSLSATAQSQTQIDVSWTKGSGAEKTMVRRKIGSYPTSVSDGDQAYFDTGSNFNDTSLSCGNNYYYRAWSYKTNAPNSGYSDSYAEDNASTNACNSAPTVPTLSSPADGAIGQSLTPDLVFNYSDSDSDTCTKFDLKVDNDSGFGSPEVNETNYTGDGPWASGGTITYSVSSGLSVSTKYYWKVRVYDGTAWSNWSDGSWDFTTGTGKRIISKGDSPYKIEIDDSLNVTGYIDNQTVTTQITKAWHHIVLTYDKDAGGTDEIKLYVDGVLKDTGDYSTAMSVNSDVLKIGDKIPGKIDDVRIYDYARSPDEIRLDYNAGFATMFGSSGMTCSEDPASCMDNGLVGYWDMDEGDGQTLYNAADTGSANDGTLGSSAGTDTNDPKWINRDRNAGASSVPIPVGSAGGALDFDGSNDYVNCGNDPSLNITDAITIEAWVKKNSDKIQSIVSHGCDEWYLRIDDTGKLHFLESQIASVLVGNTILSNDAWHHAAVTLSGTTVTLYLNGAFDGTNTTSAIFNDGSQIVTIGRETNDGGLGFEFFDGVIDGVKIYNRALSTEEIRYHYNRGGPVAHWRMDEGEGSIAYDESSNNNDGTLGNGTAAYEPTWVEGKYGSALNFDGTNDYVSCGNDASLNITDAITLEAWVKPDSQSGWDVIMSKDNGMSASRYGMGTKNGEIVFTTKPVTSGTWYTGISLPSGFHHLAAIYNGSQKRIYLDGELMNSTSATGNLGTINNPLKIGEGYLAESECGEFNGIIDDVRIYNYARTPAQIQMDYNDGLATHLGPSGMTCSEDPASCMDNGLVASYDMDEGDGQTLYNAATTGSVNDGTLGSSAGADSADPKYLSVINDQSSMGPSGSALEFDGSNDYVNCGNDSSLNITDAITVEVWTNPALTGGGPYPKIATKLRWDSPTERGGFYLYLSNAGTCEFTILNDANAVQASITGITANQWVHIVGTYNSNTDLIAIYKNGEFVDDTTYTAGMGEHASINMRISHNWDYFNGSIDGVKIYNRALSAEEIRYHYNRGGPVAHWRMDEGEGSTAYDETSNNNDGTLGGGTAAHEPTWVEGKHGSAIDFDGTDDYVDCGNNSSLDITDAITIEAWVKPNGASEQGYLITKTDVSTAGGYGLLWLATNEVRLYHGGSSYAESNAVFIDNNAWVHFVVTLDASDNVNFYRNGVNAGSDTGSLESGSLNVLIGNRTGGTTGSHWFNGSIDEVRIYNYARTPAQIQMDYNAGFSTHLK